MSIYASGIHLLRALNDNSTVNRSRGIAMWRAVFTQLLTLAAFGTLPGVTEAGEAPPAPPSYASPLIDDLAYSDAELARAAWQPMTDSAPVSVMDVGNRRVLRMPCNFAQTAQRACLVGPNGEARFDGLPRSTIRFLLS